MVTFRALMVWVYHIYRLYLEDQLPANLMQKIVKPAKAEEIERYFNEANIVRIYRVK